MLRLSVPTLELLEAQLPVVVQVRVHERLLRSHSGKLLRRHAHTLSGTRLSLVQHLEHRRQVRGHLVDRNEPVAVDVVQSESSLHLIVPASTAQNRQTTGQLAEVDHTVAVSVKQLEQLVNDQLDSLHICF